MGKPVTYSYQGRENQILLQGLSQGFRQGPGQIHQKLEEAEAKARRNEVLTYLAGSLSKSLRQSLQQI